MFQEIVDLFSMLTWTTVHTYIDSICCLLAFLFLLLTFALFKWYVKECLPSPIPQFRILYSLCLSDDLKDISRTKIEENIAWGLHHIFLPPR